MTPLITIQILGLITVIKNRRCADGECVLTDMDEDAIIEL